MSDDRVPESLMEAFERGPDGTFGVRKVFGSDGLALLYAILLPLVVAAAVYFILWIVGRIWLDDEDAALAGALIGLAA